MTTPRASEDIAEAIGRIERELLELIGQGETSSAAQQVRQDIKHLRNSADSAERDRLVVSLIGVIGRHPAARKRLDEEIRAGQVRCPYCGNPGTLPIGLSEGMGSVIRFAGPVQQLVNKIKLMLSDPELDAANAWVDMPRCEKCRNIYRYNAQTGEVQK